MTLLNVCVSMPAAGSAGREFRPGRKLSYENFKFQGDVQWRCTKSNRKIVQLRPILNFKPIRSYVEKIYCNVHSDSSVGREL